MQIELGFSLFDWTLAHLPDFLRRFIPSIIIDRLRPLAQEWQTTGEKLLSEKLAPIIQPFLPAVHVLTHLKDSTVGFLDRGIKLVESVHTEYVEIKNFKEDLHWRGRVVSAPETLKKIKHLTEIPLEVVNACKDLFRRIKDTLPRGKGFSEVADEAADALEGIEDFRGAVTKWAPKLAKGLERSLGVLALLVDAIVSWNAALDDLQRIVDDVKELRLDIEKLDLIFLPQEHKRRWVKLDDGRRVRWRIGGRMHPT